MEDYDDPLAALLAPNVQSSQESDEIDDPLAALLGESSSKASGSKDGKKVPKKEPPAQIEKVELIKNENTNNSQPNNQQLAIPKQEIKQENNNGQIVGFDEVEIPNEVWPKIDNVIASINMGTTVDLKTIAFKARNAEYNPRKVNAVVMRLREPRCTALVYQGFKNFSTKFW